MNSVYILEYKIHDKLGRTKKTCHVGVYDSLDKLEQAKVSVVSNTENVVFTVYNSEHILFK